MEVKKLNLAFALTIPIVFIVLLFISSCGPPQDTPNNGGSPESTWIISPTGGSTKYTIKGSVLPEGSGTITLAGDNYEAGANVTLVAEPSSGYVFSYWSGSASGTTSSVVVTVDSDKYVIAHFKKQYTLTISVSPSDAGTINPTGGIYDADAKATLFATPASGYAFDYWSGDATGTSTSVNVYMHGDKDVVAHFKKADKTTSVTSSTPSGTGRTISAVEAQQAVQMMLDVLSHETVIIETDTGERIGGSYLPNGAEIPKNGRVGTPTLVNVNGVPAWKVPVLTSNGVRIGEIYVKQIRSKPNRVDFITFGQYSPTGLETEYGTYR